jgi:hypothetical protein
MPYAAHSVFEAPAGNPRIWRFMNFHKFVSMITTGSLYFSRLDKLGDPFEGLHTKARIQFDEKVYDSYDSSQSSEYGKSVIRGMHLDPYEQRRKSFVNCWHMNEYETELLWSRYSFMDGGVAIQSTFERLKSCLNVANAVYIGMIKYKDWETERTPIDSNMMKPIVTKRINYRDERELRAAIVTRYNRRKQTQLGMNVPVDLIELVESVYISPKSGDWILKLIKTVLKKYDLDLKVKKSVFTEKPMRPKFLKKHPMY